MTPTETQVSAICSRILALDHVDPNDDLYELGSDSHQAVLIALEVERTFRVKLPLEILEASARVCTLAAWIDRQSPAPWSPEAVSGGPSPTS